MQMSEGASIPDRWPAIGMDTLRRNATIAIGYSVPFFLVLYLAIRGGGYSPIVRGEIGIAVWWIVLLGIAVGALPVARLSRAGWALLALLAAVCAWTGAGIIWSESSERSVAEFARVASLLGVLALSLFTQGTEGLRRATYGVGAAIALVGVLALLSRLHPAWFPENDAAALLGETKSRLSYPLNYWNGLAALLAVGIPLLLAIATSARHTVTRVIASAAVPALCVATFYTLSRGGALELLVAVMVLICLHPHRLTLLPTLLVAGTGGAIAVAAANQREALADGATGSAAAAQGDEMLAIVLITCAGVGLLQAAITLAARWAVGPRLDVPRRRAAIISTVAALTVAGVALAAGAPSEMAERWDQFKQPTAGATGSAVERFESASGNGRYQYWQSALDANATAPLTGIGPGTFEYWWSREGTLPGFIKDAHSLYFESLAELGIVGLILIGGLIVFVLVAGSARTLRTSGEQRVLAAAAVAGCFAFAVSAAIDWSWELTVLPVTFLVLAAGLLTATERAQHRRPRPTARIALVGFAVAALVVIAIPLTGASEIRASQAHVDSAELSQALTSARAAKEVQPYAATPSLQEALIMELAGDVEGARIASAKATQEEPTNWRTWLVRSRIEAEAGNAQASLSAYREAKALNPRSPLFQEG